MGTLIWAYKIKATRYKKKLGAYLLANSVLSLTMRHVWVISLFPALASSIPLNQVEHLTAIGWSVYVSQNPLKPIWIQTGHHSILGEHLWWDLPFLWRRPNMVNRVSISWGGHWSMLNLTRTEAYEMCELLGGHLAQVVWWIILSCIIVIPLHLDIFIFPL